MKNASESHLHILGFTILFSVQGLLSGFIQVYYIHTVFFIWIVNLNTAFIRCQWMRVIWKHVNYKSNKKGDDVVRQVPLEGREKTEFYTKIPFFSVNRLLSFPTQSVPVWYLMVTTAEECRWNVSLASEFLLVHTDMEITFVYVDLNLFDLLISCSVQGQNTVFGSAFKINNLPFCLCVCCLTGCFCWHCHSSILTFTSTSLFII